MLSLKAHWLNPPEDTKPDVVEYIEKKYAQWMTVLADDDVPRLREVFNIASRHHWEYQLWDAKAVRGIRHELDQWGGRRAEFHLEFRE